MIFGRALRLLAYFMYAHREGFGMTTQMRRLAWVFAGRLCDKYHKLARNNWDTWINCCYDLKNWTEVLTHEMHLDKTNNAVARPEKTQISLGIRPVWSESSLSTWRKLGSLATHWVHSKDSDQTGLGAQPHCWFCHEAVHIKLCVQKM